jgi:hypothetical protein
MPGGAAEVEVIYAASGVARVLVGFEEFDGLEVSKARLLIHWMSEKRWCLLRLWEMSWSGR